MFLLCFRLSLQLTPVIPPLDLISGSQLTAHLRHTLATLTFFHLQMIYILGP